MIAPAFMPFRQVIEEMLAFQSEIVDDQAGVRSYIYEYEIESPVELSIVRDEKGDLQVGSTPPLYYADTTFRPSYHRLRFTALLNEDFTEASDGD